MEQTVHPCNYSNLIRPAGGMRKKTGRFWGGLSTTFSGGGEKLIARAESNLQSESARSASVPGCWSSGECLLGDSWPDRHASCWSPLAYLFQDRLDRSCKPGRSF